MTLKKVCLAIAASVTLLGAVSAQAHGLETPSFYGSVAVSQSRLTTDVAGVDRDATGGSVALGATFEKHVGVELSYQDLGRIDTIIGKARADAVGLQLVGYLPVCKNVNLFVKPGVFHTHMSLAGDSSSKTQFGLGVGAEYALNKRVALTGTVQRLNDFADVGVGVTSYQAGLKVNF
jgi:opacity protein-like surface antigen